MKVFAIWSVFFLCSFFCFHSSGEISGGVVINEISAAGSDRLLQRDGSGGYPKLGMTTPWYMPDYDDSHWKTGPGPFGFGSFTDVTFGVNTSSEMQGKVPSLYLRKEFEVSAGQASIVGGVGINIRYNDGFIAFLNGVEIARSNMGNAGMFAYCDQTAFNPNTNDAVEVFITGISTNLLVQGTNVFCVQVHNKSLTGTDAASLLLDADLFIARRTPIPLFDGAEQWKYFVGELEPSGGLVDYGLFEEAPVTIPWALPEFNDSSWVESPGPVGYDRGADYVLGTNLVDEMYGITASVYARTRFYVSQDELLNELPLSLNIDYDDAIIVFLNGVEVARRNVGVANTVTPYTEFASGGHNANGDGGGSTTGQDETVLLAAANTLLVPGVNVLSVQVHNSSLTSSDLIGRATLSTTGASARALVAPEDSCRFFVGLSEPAPVDPGDEMEVRVEEPDAEADWIEIYNSGTNVVDLSGWSLTDNEDDREKWLFPTGAVIEAGGYLLVMATGYDLSFSDGASYLHTSFKLDKNGEYIGLYNDSGTLIDELTPGYPEQLPFYSYARGENGSFGYHSRATPGEANSGESCASILDAPGLSKEGGHYSDAVLIQLFANADDVEIRYTLDGSEPAQFNGLLYDGPITLNASAVVRARCVKDGYVPSPIVTHTYLISQPTGLQGVPAICISSDPVLSIYGPNAQNGPAAGEGIMSIKGGSYDEDNKWVCDGDHSAFNIPMQYGRAFEKPSSLEFFPTSGNSIKTDFGLRISGSGHARPRYKLEADPTGRFPDSWAHKPSFNFFFRGELGDNPLDYPFFPDYTVTKFGDVRLRAGKNDAKNPFIRDELMRRIYLGTGQEGSVGIITTLFINGVYKGYYNLCEHLREAFMQQHFNSDKSWDVVQVGKFASGDSTRWNEMISFLRKNDLTTTSNYCQVHNYLDVDNFIDYLLVNTFAATWDWPHNNWVAGRERSDEGRWRFFMWDAEGGFLYNRDPAVYDSFSSDLDIGDDAMSSWKYIPVIYTLLKDSPEFRLRFADRVQKHCFHGGTLTKTSMTEKYVKLRDTMNPVMQATNGETVNEAFYNDWIATDTRRTTWFGQLATYGYWPSTSAPEFSPYGGVIDEGSSVVISNPNGNGTIYFTTNGVDPRMCGGAVAGTQYTVPVIMSSSVTLKARVLSSGGAWSPLQEVFFQVPVEIQEFLPSGDADWTLDSNWNSSPAPYPDGADLKVIIYGPPTAKREISLRAPVTVGEIQFSMEGCLFRNRIRDRDSGNTLTFCSSGEASISVDGEGPGYVEFKVEAGVVLDSNLRITVNNTMGDSEYGALRLRENLSGVGGLIKDGPGMASMTGDSKSYTGPTVINQGVLRVSEPACPRQSSGVEVCSGGQLRLSSSGTVEEPRVYSFGGFLQLGSVGRSGDLAGVSGHGVSGGLRYDPGDSDSYAVISNQISLSSVSCIHVEGSDNNLSFAASLHGNYGFVKSGGGSLVIGCDNAAYIAPVTVSNGTLVINGVLPSALDIAEDGVLSGCGQSGPLQGDGTVELDGTILQSPAAVGLDYELSFKETGPPDYMNTVSSGNSLLRLASIQPGASPSSIDIYLDCPFVSGDTLRGGIFVEGGNGLAGFLSRSTVTFYVPDLNGSRSFAARDWSVYTGVLPLSATAMPEVADFGDGPRAGHIIEIRVAGPSVTFNEWMMQCFTNPADRSNSSVSGPLACPLGDGTPNLTRYAFDIDAYESIPEKMPSFVIETGIPHYEFSFDPGKNDLTTLVEAGHSLTNWSRLLFDSATDDLSRWDGERVHIEDAESGPVIHSNQFYRLRLQLEE